ncbi:extracellular solute-binding protein [Virgisporangium aurantiacum]|uniref:Sugar ABC transporter substrate-binding protein n=1 Tax=Virgisporangium aurantiacum TaxID=175570 RepID=A0A8J3Z522_9ACTN|nr:extracellular solute-binding protein [Virgisporangium aurantiacum]GIJ56987.1 sugar ABC transporter substrate-binding protein [Virgisporangium aurantiacum]
MRVTRPRALWAFLVAVVVAGTTACGGGNGGGDKQTVTFLTHWAPEQVKMLEDAAAAYARTHQNVDVRIRAVPFANLLSTLRTQGASPNGPTIASIYDLWLPELVRDGIAAPVPDRYAADLQTNWPANLVEGVTKNGKRYGFPNEVDLYALNYNKKLFAAAGITEPPKTWAELESAAAKLTKPGQQGFGVITSWPAGVVHPFVSLVNSNGGQLLSGTTPNLTDPKVTAVADLYKRLIAAKSTDPAMSQANANTTGPYLDSFVNGKTGMIIMANWWQGSLKQAMGDRYADVGVAPIPVGPSGSKSSAVSYSWLTTVNAKASQARQDAAWDFLAWLNGPESGKNGSSAMADVLMSMGILPSRTSDIAAHNTALSEPFLKVYVEQLGNATPFPTVLGGEQMSQIIQKHVENVVFGKAEPGNAMRSAQDEAAAALQKANG